jgi:rod shape-determining protein MreD
MNKVTPTFCLICSSFLVGMVLMLLHLPPIINWLGPLWLVLILCYFALTAPQYVNVGIALLIGLLLDLVYNTAFGEHGLVLIIVVFFVIKLRQKIIPFGLVSWQMALIMLGMMAFYQLLLFFLQLYLGEYFNSLAAFGGAILSGVAWLPLALLLFNYQQKLRI